LGRQVEKDSHGNVQLAGSGILGDFLGDLIKDKLKIKRVRSDTFGYLQRSFPSLAVSQTDADEARMVGKVAVEYSRDESKREGSIAMIRKSNSPYKIETIFTSIKNVARETKHLDAQFLDGTSNISNAFIEYAKPLVGPLPKTASLDEVR
jgi:6-phosphofructokinase 1